MQSMDERAAALPEPGTWLERLADRFGARFDRNPEEAFQRRFLLGCDVLGIAVAAISLPHALLTHQVLVASLMGGFAVALVALMVLMRTGIPLGATVWANALLLSAFFFLASVQNDEVQPEQFGWLLLLPLFAVPSMRARAAGQPKADLPFTVPIASVLAAGVAVAIVAAHEHGWTFHQPTPSSPWDTIAEFIPLLVAVSGIVTLYERLLRGAEQENRALRELLPVCAWCHQIRDDGGTWHAVDRYMRRQGAKVTHSICPSCATRHFPTDGGGSQ